MWLVSKIRRLLTTFFFDSSPLTLLITVFGYFFSSYLLLVMAGESELIRQDTFFYWIIVTASTVGYGDASPTTTLGKIVVSLWVIPLGLSVFALVLTKLGFYLSELATKGRRGLRMLHHHQNHIVIIGWNAGRTLRLIELLLAKQSSHPKRIVLCVVADIENPLPGVIDFVKVEAFTHEATMKRANLAQASRIIIDTHSDDITLTTALFCEKVSPNCHATAYFQDESLGELLRKHCPSVECIPSVAVEMLANSALDPGSSDLHKQLLDSTYGMTQYTLVYQGKETRIRSLFDQFKTEFSATLIGLKNTSTANSESSQKAIQINPDLEELVYPGATLFYIAKERLNADSLV